MPRGQYQRELPSVVVNMSDVFESYLRRVLTASARKGAWPLMVLDGNKAPPAGGKGEVFDSGEEVVATPDIVIRRSQTAQSPSSVIVEVKYKPVKARPSRHDLNQAITYGFAYGAEHVVLALPRPAFGGPTHGLGYLGQISNLNVWQYVFDLNAVDLIEEERLWADRIRSLTRVLDILSGISVGSVSRVDSDSR